MPFVTSRARAPASVTQRARRVARRRGAPRPPHRDRRGRAGRASLPHRLLRAPQPLHGDAVHYRTSPPCARASRASSAARRVFPMPRGPETTTTCPCRCLASPHASRSHTRSSWRPIKRGAHVELRRQLPSAQRCTASATSSLHVRSARRAPWPGLSRGQARAHRDSAGRAAALRRARRAPPSTCGPRRADGPSGIRRAHSRGSRGRRGRHGLAVICSGAV